MISYKCHHSYWSITTVGHENAFSSQSQCSRCFHHNLNDISFHRDLRLWNASEEWRENKRSFYLSIKVWNNDNQLFVHQGKDNNQYPRYVLSSISYLYYGDGVKIIILTRYMMIPFFTVKIKMTQRKQAKKNDKKNICLVTVKMTQRKQGKNNYKKNIFSVTRLRQHLPSECQRCGCVWFHSGKSICCVLIP